MKPEEKENDLPKKVIVWLFVVCTAVAFYLVSKHTSKVPIAERRRADSLFQLSLQKEALKDAEKKLNESNEADKKNKDKKEALDYAKKNFRVKYDDIENINWIYDYSSPKYSNYTGHYVYLGVTDDYVNVRFRLQYVGENWLFVENIIFKIDDQKYSFIPEKVIRDNSGDEIWEIIDVDATSAEIQPIITALRNCKTAKVRFEGSEHYADRIITKKQIDAIKRMFDLRFRLEPI